LLVTLFRKSCAEKSVQLFFTLNDGGFDALKRRIFILTMIGSIIAIE